MDKLKTFIIAEIGVNHNNDLKTAFKLIRQAKTCGADAIKIQIYKTENLILKNTPAAKYQKKNNKKNLNQFELLKNLELSESKLNKIINYAKKIGIMIFASPFDFWSIDYIKKKKNYPY